MWSNIHARVMEIEPTEGGRKLRVRFGASPVGTQGLLPHPFGLCR